MIYHILYIIYHIYYILYILYIIYIIWSSVFLPGLAFFPQGSLQQPLRDSTAVRWPGTKGWPVDTEVRWTIHVWERASTRWSSQGQPGRARHRNCEAVDITGTSVEVQCKCHRFMAVSLSTGSAAGIFSDGGCS